MPAESESYERFPEKERLLGQGRFGIVKKVRRQSDLKILACKSIRFREENKSRASVEREYAILSLLDHPNIVKQVDVAWFPYKAKIYMEYCERGSLQDLIEEKTRTNTVFAEKYVWTILFQLTAALLYCHHGLRVDNKNGAINSDTKSWNWDAVLHRDIKPANVFLSSDSETALDAIKLGDFGLGHILEENAAPSTYAGTQQFMPPEVNRMQTRSIRWTKHCDIFSLGCTIYTLCTFKPPFEWRMESESDVFDRIPTLYSNQLQSCIVSCLAFHPGERNDLMTLLRRSQPHVSLESSGVPRGATTVVSTELGDGHVENNRFSFPNSDTQASSQQKVPNGQLSQSHLTKSQKKRNRKKVREEALGLPIPPRMTENSPQSAHPGQRVQGARTFSNPDGRLALRPEHSNTNLEKTTLEIQSLDHFPPLDPTSSEKRTPNSSTQRRSIPHDALEFKLSRQLRGRLIELVKAGEVSAIKDELAGHGIPQYFKPLWNAFPEAVYIATSSRRLEMVQFLAQVRANLNFSGPILRAAQDGNASIVKVLVDHGAEVDKMTSDQKKTALSCAATEGNLDIVELLLAAKPSIDMADDMGRTALHWAALHGHASVVELLLKNEADDTLKDHQGAVPRTYAIQEGHLGVWKILLKPATRGVEKFLTPAAAIKMDKKSHDKAVKLYDLMRFSKEFKLKTPMPIDLVPIVAKDKAKQDRILEKNSQDFPSSLPSTPRIADFQ